MDLNRSTIGVVACAMFVCLCALLWPFVADDAFIVGRYAANAAAGNGLVYNPGEYVTALTSPLHALVETAIAGLGFDPVQGYRTLAVALPLVAWIWVARFVEMGTSRLILFTILGLGSPFLAMWTVGGLETPILALLATFFTVELVLITRQGHAHARQLIALGVLAGLMFITRFDSILVTAPILFAVLLVEWRRPVVWLAGGLSLAIASSWLVFSALYYGDILPTSFHVKLGISSRPPIDNVAALLNFLVLSGVVLAVLLCGLKTGEKQKGVARAIELGGASSLVVFLIYAAQASGQHMMFGYRFFMPYILPMALVIALIVRTPRPSRLAAGAIGQATLALIVATMNINPTVLNRLPILSAAYAEYQFVTIKDYAEFIAVLEEDAALIRAHWQATGATEQPAIYLRTGGTGYFLPEFYVFETLVSYRHKCGAPMQSFVEASHYVQNLGFTLSGQWPVRLARARSDIGEDAPLLFATDHNWLRTVNTGFLYGPQPTPFALGASVHAPCGEAQYADGS